MAAISTSAGGVSTLLGGDERSDLLRPWIDNWRLHVFGLAVDLGGYTLLRFDGDGTRDAQAALFGTFGVREGI